MISAKVFLSFSFLFFSFFFFFSVLLKFKLITSFKLMSIHSGSFDISGSRVLLNFSMEGEYFPKPHSKVYIFDDVKAIMAHRNLAYGGMPPAPCMGFYLDEPLVVRVHC